MFPRLASRLIFLVLLATAAASAPACELCAVFAASQSRAELGQGPFAGVAEQFTYFGTLQQDGQEVPNPADQFLASSITQLLLGYNFTERLGVQFNAPLIYRSFRRTEGSAIDQGTVAGLGDVSLLGSFQAYSHNTMRSTLTWNIIGGVKFPTGSTSYLQEETQEMPPAPGDIPSAIHGHDLTLGSGSYDGIIGTSFYARWKRWFLAAAVQYSIRSTGAYDYRFANDLTWSGGPGWYAILNDNYTIALQVVTSGETKGLDTLGGVPAEDTGVTAVYLGPQFLFTWSDKLTAQLGLDLPVSIANTGLQAVPDYRVRAAVTWHF